MKRPEKQPVWQRLLSPLIRPADDRIQQEQIRILYQQSPFVFLGIVFVMLVVTAFLWERVDRPVLLIWLAVNIGLTLLRVVMVKSFARRQPQGEALLRWGPLFALSSTISGMIWGSISLLFMDPQHIETVLLVAIVLTGMSAGSLVPLSSFILACYGFTLSALLPLAYIMITQGSELLNLIAYLVLAFLLVNLAYAVIDNRNLAESIRLRFENLDLLDDLRQQKEIAEKANTDKSRFLAATSHDLRQPLHAMDLYLGALKNLLNTGEQTELLEKSLRSSAALNELLSTLMDISRLDSGEVVIHRGLLDLRQLLRDIVDEYQPQAAQRGIDLRLQDMEAVVVDSDATMLGRMLRNLLNNACSHSQASEIVLGVERQDGQAVVSVCDDGIGIPPEQQEQVFSEFYQLGNPERDRSKGLGLGLAIVRRLAILLEHPLSLDSDSDRGSCFRLSLPVLDVPPDSLQKGSEEQDIDLAGRFIVLVDDEKEIRLAMRSLLLQWGCELLVADSLQSLQAELDALDYPVPDLLLCDYRLREHQTGLEVAAALRCHFDAPVPVIIISGDTSKSIARAVDASGYHMLFKPVAPDKLRQAIHQQLSKVKPVV